MAPDPDALPFVDEHTTLVEADTDAVWQELSLWVDSNADGIATPNEMRRPESLGLTSFGIIPRVRRYIDDAGNSLPYWAWAGSTGRPARTMMVDVYFLQFGPEGRP